MSDSDSLARPPTDQTADRLIEWAALLKRAQAREGLIKHLGIEFELHGDELIAYLTVRSEHSGSPGVLHGGGLMTLFDSALGFRAFQLAHERGCATSTVEMKVNFLRPVRLGQRLRVKPEVISSGQSLVVLSGEAIEVESGTRMGIAIGTFNLFNPARLKRS